MTTTATYTPVDDTCWVDKVWSLYAFMPCTTFISISSSATHQDALTAQSFIRNWQRTAPFLACPLASFGCFPENHKACLLNFNLAPFCAVSLSKLDYLQTEASVAVVFFLWRICQIEQFCITSSSGESGGKVLNCATFVWLGRLLLLKSSASASAAIT